MRTELERGSRPLKMEGGGHWLAPPCIDPLKMYLQESFSF
jgi:hypothetical protein